MKRILSIILLVAFTGLFLWGCSEEDSDYEYYDYKASLTIDNKSYELDLNDNSIYDGRFTYKVTTEEYDGGTIYTFTYPNKSYWSMDVLDGKDIGKIEYSDDYGESRYAEGEVLYKVYTTLKPSVEDKGIFNIKINPIKVVIGIVFVGIGVIMIAFPYKIWRIYEGWKFEEEVEPSGAYIGMTVASGVFLIIVTVALVLFA